MSLPPVDMPHAWSRNAGRLTWHRNLPHPGKMASSLTLDPGHWLQLTELIEVYLFIIYLGWNGRKSILVVYLGSSWWKERLICFSQKNPHIVTLAPWSGFGRQGPPFSLCLTACPACLPTCLLLVQWTFSAHLAWLLERKGDEALAYLSSLVSQDFRTSGVAILLGHPDLSVWSPLVHQNARYCPHRHEAHFPDGATSKSSGPR
jgi:hypothetical protein